MVVFKLNGFYTPVVRGVEEGIPRLICDFNNTEPIDSTNKLIKADGRFIKVIKVISTSGG